MITVKRQLHFGVEARGRKRIETQPAATTQVEPGRTPRISRLMALAIHCDGLIRSGTVADQTELAQLLRVSQPRMTQILNLLHLAPDIQETLLHLPRTTSGRDPITEKLLRPIAAEVSWETQRQMWRNLSH